MHVQSETEIISFQGRTMRVRRANAAPTRLLLLVHGWTGDENSMWVFVHNFPPNVWIIAPRAPYVTEPGGYSWLPRKAGTNTHLTFAEIQPAAESLLSLVDAYAAENSLDAGQFDVMGFSQGAALVSSLALMHPQRIQRAGLLAGFVPDGAQEAIQLRPLEAKPIFVAHGTLDERVNIELARRSVALLESAGARVTYCEDDVGHKLSARCLRALHAFFM